MTTRDTTTPHARALGAIAAVVLVLLALRYVLKIDIWYVLSGGVTWVLAAETAIAGFLLGWFFGSKGRSGRTSIDASSLTPQ